MQRAALLLLTLVFVGLLLALWITAPTDAEEPSEPPAIAPSLWSDFGPDDVSEVLFVDKDPAGYTLLHRDETWSVRTPDGDEVAARPQRARAVVAALASLESLRAIHGPPVDYGLGESALRVLVTLEGGDSRLLRVGDALPVGEGHYVAVGSDREVHVVPSLPLAMVAVDPLDLIAQEPTP
ncbi:MAG: hypothetical protein KDA24_26345 [Deltaproteobacteria bacterium]|nr:hypothetical protein [Deltaproteobacteria bacterium]